jgi:hypothetical protein
LKQCPCQRRPADLFPFIASIRAEGRGGFAFRGTTGSPNDDNLSLEAVSTPEYCIVCISMKANNTIAHIFVKVGEELGTSGQHNAHIWGSCSMALGLLMAVGPSMVAG